MRAGLLVLLAACGGSDAGTPQPDAAPPADAGHAGAYPVDRVGLVNLFEAGVGTDIGWFPIHASILDQPEYPLPVKRAELGDCAVFVRPQPSLCDPGCTGGDVCVDGACRPAPQKRSAGPITVTGLLEALVFQPTAYGYQGPDHRDDLFAAGAALRFRAPGDDVGGFDVTLTAPAPLAAPEQNLTLVDGQDATFTWTAANDARIQLALVVGWHGAPWEAMLLCETADDGELVVPGALVSELPRASSTLESHSSWLMRFSRALVAGDDGPIEIVVGSQRNVHFSHP